MKTNEQLQKDVQNAIKWERLLNAAEIGVVAKDGIVSLTGVVDSYSKKLEAENAAKSVAGVLAVAESIEVKFESSYIKNDAEIAKGVLNAWGWHWDIPADKIKVKVENGWVTLEGEVQWNSQKQEAKKTIVNLMGVRGVSNNITIKSETHDKLEKQAVEQVLSNNWSLNNKNIKVQVLDNHVTLTGMVDSLYQKDEAARLAWNAPGVWTMDNNLVVQYR